MLIFKFTLLVSISFLLSSFSSVENISLVEFSKKNLSEFKVISDSDVRNFVASVEIQNLHSEMFKLKVKARKSHSNKNSYNKTVFTRIKMWEFQFKTDEKCNQVVDSLLACFPNDCANIKHGEDKMVHIHTSIWIINNKSIYVAEIACAQVDEKWEKFKRDFKESFADTDSEIIITECGKLTWENKE